MSSRKTEDLCLQFRLNVHHQLHYQLIAQLSISKARNPEAEALLKELSGTIMTDRIRTAIKHWNNDRIEALSQKPEADFQAALASAALEEFDIGIFERLPLKIIQPLADEISRRTKIYFAMDRWLTGNG